MTRSTVRIFLLSHDQQRDRLTDDSTPIGLDLEGKSIPEYPFKVTFWLYGEDDITFI